MRNFDRNTSHPNQNRHFKQTSRTNLKQLKFERTKKQSNTLPLHYNLAHTYQNTNRKYIYDQEAMNQMIITLKQQNNQLKNLIKIQQTQISYFQQQERNLMLNTQNNTNRIMNSGKSQQNTPNTGNPRKVQLQNFRLRKQVRKLEEEISKIKKTIKCTNIKQLQIQLLVYQEEIKNMTAKLTSYQKSTTNIQQINTIIQKQYFSTLKNKQLQTVVDEKCSELEHSAKIIRKLRNIISQKNNQIQIFKQERLKIQNIITKNKNSEEYVPKAELITKKKQLLALTQAIEKLELKLIECEAKAQALQQENIDNMNRQTTKRKEILSQFQKLKKNHDALEQALALSIKKSSDTMPLRLDKVPDLDTSFRKPRIPKIVTIQLIKKPIETAIYNLQKNNIDHNSALSLISKTTSSKTEESEKSQSEISIREIIHCLQSYPISLCNYEGKQMLARYLVENQSDESQFINFDSFVNISYVRSVFKLLLNEYPIFSCQQINNHCLVVQDFLKRNEHALKVALNKIATERPEVKAELKIQQNDLNISNVGANKRKCEAYKCQDYIEGVVREHQLSEVVIKFIKYWTFKERQNYMTYKQFTEYFKTEGVCTFITQDPHQAVIQNSKPEDQTTQNPPITEQNIKSKNEQENGQNFEIIVSNV